MIPVTLKLTTSVVLFLGLLGAAVAGGQYLAAPPLPQPAAPKEAAAPKPAEPDTTQALLLALAHRKVEQFHTIQNCAACHQIPGDFFEKHLLGRMVNPHQPEPARLVDELAQRLDRATAMELLRKIEQRDAQTRTAQVIQGVDESLKRTLPAHLDRATQAATLDGVIRHLQDRRKKLDGPAEPRKP